MTVNQSSFTYFQSMEPREAGQLLDQLREITGVQDDEVLMQALDRTRSLSGTYDVSRAVALLVENSRASDQSADTPADVTIVAECPAGRKVRVHSPADQTDSDLRRAIELSLQEQPPVASASGISSLDEQIAKVVEASIADQNAGTKRKRGAPWVDALSPAERKRQDGWPVGLKNVGNTCWFSAVVQSLFHLPAFRGLVLRYRPIKRDRQTAEEERTAQFMLELRRLFALLVASEKRDVDPSAAVDLLKKVLDGGATDSQQDISEFMHKLLEWLEEAFKHSDIGEDSGRGDLRTRNPMISLFYGQHKTEGIRDGAPYTQTETFGQFPLSVVPGRDLHQALEASTTAGCDRDGAATPGSGAHQWFTVLPPVLLLELSRFNFDQSSGQTQKLHDRLTFPAQMHMDRYLEINKNVVIGKRAEIAELRRTRRDLNKRLHQYLSFGATAPRLPLSRLLRHTLQYARGSSADTVHDVDMEMAASSVTSMMVDSPVQSPQPARRSDNSPEMPGLVSPPVGADVAAATGLTAEDGTASGASAALAPTHTSGEELAVVQRCLERWTEEVDKQVYQLKKKIQEIDVKIETMFNEPVLQQVPYRLHSVLVHEGQAGSGHYWAYVLHPQRKVWMKFNDNTVSEASWDALCVESVGGHHNTSAYCLIYIDVNRHELMDDRPQVDKEAGMVDSADNALQLPLPLQQYVDEDNRRFQTELAAWNQQQQTASSEDQPMEEEEAAARTHWAELSSRHAALSAATTLKLLRETMADSPNANAQQLLTEAIRRCIKLLRAQCTELDNEPSLDHRMTSMGVYMLRNNAQMAPDLRWMLLQHFNQPAVWVATNLRHVHQCAGKELWQIEEKCSEEEKRRFRCWHVQYNEFRWVAWSAVLGLGHLVNERYSEALLYLLQACSKNDELLAQGGRPHRGFDPALLAEFRRKAVMGLNKQAVDTFVSGQLEQATQMTQSATVPALVVLARSERERDRIAAEDVRNRWCNLLEQPLDDRSQGVLQTIITLLVEPTSSHERTSVSIKVQAGMEQQLAQQYREALSRLKQDG